MTRFFAFLQQLSFRSWQENQQKPLKEKHFEAVLGQQFDLKMPTFKKKAKHIVPLEFLEKFCSIEQEAKRVHNLIQ